jgi:hypothetical protein
MSVDGSAKASESTGVKQPPIQSEYNMNQTWPWFRDFWAMDGEALFPEAHSFLHNRHFVASAHQLFALPIVRPINLLVNLMGPMPAGNPHLDTPSYRGINRGEVPGWLLLSMRASGLFERWRVRQAAAISWTYRGSGGAFEYWPQGLEGPSVLEGPPFGNMAIVADNDYMLHRVQAIGDESTHVPPECIPLGSELRRDDGDWLIAHENAVTHRLSRDEVRISILWKAFALGEDEATLLDAHEDDLTVAEIVASLNQAVGSSISFETPEESFNDPNWARSIVEAYPWRS